jgi:hypothetical protein
MRKFTFWYKKEIEAPSLEKAIKIEKKTPHVLSSVEHTDEQPKEYTTFLLKIRFVQ